MPDLFKRTMAAAYDERELSQAPGFLQGFFGKNPAEIVASETEVVEVDVIRDSRKLAVDVIRGGAQANVNLTGRFSTKEYKPPLYAEEAPITASMLNKRRPGEEPYTPANQAANLAYHARVIQREQAMKIWRELERMAAEIFQAGTVTLKNMEQISFGRKGTHHVTPTTKWAPAAGTPLVDIRNLGDVVFQDGKLKPDILIFGSAAWSAFIGNNSVQSYLDTRLIDPGRIAPAEQLPGATYQGRIWIGDYQFDMYSYPEFYLNATDVVVPYITTDTMLMFNRSARYLKAFAAVELLSESVDRYRELGLPLIPEFRSGQIVPYVYEKPPAALMAGVQSAPLLIPTAIDTFGDLYNVD